MSYLGSARQNQHIKIPKKKHKQPLKDSWLRILVYVVQITFLSMKFYKLLSDAQTLTYAFGTWKNKRGKQHCWILKWLCAGLWQNNYYSREGYIYCKSVCISHSGRWHRAAHSVAPGLLEPINYCCVLPQLADSLKSTPSFCDVSDLEVLLSTR